MQHIFCRVSARRVPSPRPKELQLPSPTPRKSPTLIQLSNRKGIGADIRHQVFDDCIAFHNIGFVVATKCLDNLFPISLNDRQAITICSGLFGLIEYDVVTILKIGKIAVVTFNNERSIKLPVFLIDP